MIAPTAMSERRAFGTCFAAVCLCLALPVLLWRGGRRTTVSFKMKVVSTSTRPVSVRFYFDTGKGFRQQDSVSVAIGYEQGKFVERSCSLPCLCRIRGLRMDPLPAAGRVVVKDVRIRQYREKTLDLTKADCSRRWRHSIASISRKNGEIRISCNGEDPYFLLCDDLRIYTAIEPIDLLHALWCGGVLPLLALAITLARSLTERVLKRLYAFGLKWLGKSDRLASASLHGFVMAVVLGKIVVTIISICRFGRRPGLSDMLRSCCIDLALAVVVLAILCALKRNDKEEGNSNALQAARLCISVTLYLATVFYSSSVLVYAYWGAFPRNSDYQAFFRALSGVCIAPYYAKRFAAVVALSALLPLLAAFFFGRFRREGPAPACTAGRIFIVFTILALGAAEPLIHPYSYDQSVQSPIINLLAVLPDTSDCLAKGDLHVDLSKFTAVRRRKVDSRWQFLKASCKDLNILILVLESVRKRNLPIYGYRRDTMPFLSAMAENSLVFHAAYAHQPRSCKTLSALILGVYPDPRLTSLTWKPKSLAGADNLLRRFIRKGYEIYFGMKQPGDCFGEFMRAMAGGAITESIGSKSMKDSRHADEILVDDYLAWFGKRKNKCFALLWPEAAHFPYQSYEAPYGRKTTRDLYDNCLRRTDGIIKRLVSGMRLAGKLDDTLVVILGDHGEALGEHFDRMHGNYLYDHSIRVPFILFNRRVFGKRMDLYQRFQPKDLPATLLWLLGMKSGMRQSEIIFSRKQGDRIFLSNVYQDFKLAMIEGNEKYVYRPFYDSLQVFNSNSDPGENINLASGLDPRRIEERKLEMIRWYYYQVEYLEKNFLLRPRKCRR